jgi:hypothetical protein
MHNTIVFGDNDIHTLLLDQGALISQDKFFEM